MDWHCVFLLRLRFQPLIFASHALSSLALLRSNRHFPRTDAYLRITAGWSVPRRCDLLVYRGGWGCGRSRPTSSGAHDRLKPMRALVQQPTTLISPIYGRFLLIRLNCLRSFYHARYPNAVHGQLWRQHSAVAAADEIVNSCRTTTLR